MAMILTGIDNKNEYYTNHYFSSIFEENAGDTISEWRSVAKEAETATPWAKFRDTSRQYYRVRDRYIHQKAEEQSKPLIKEMAELYLDALGYEKRNNVVVEVAGKYSVPIFHEEVRSSGAPLLWVVLSVANERDEDILQSSIFVASNDDDLLDVVMTEKNDDILSKLFFAGEEAPRWILLIGINQIALIDRNKWNEKRYLQFALDEIFSRHEESTFQALSVLLHKDSLCPSDGESVLDKLDENSHKHSAGVSDSLKYALRECIELLGNEVIYDMNHRQKIELDANPVDAAELTVECLRYMYRVLFMLFIEARPELGYAPMKSQSYVQGYSLEGLRDVCEKVREVSEEVSEGYYIDDTISELFRLVYEGYPGDLNAYKKAIEMESMHDAFTIEALKAHIFDPEYTKLITAARLRNSTMLQIIDLMSISRTNGTKVRRGRISYSSLGINQMGAVYEALLSYRGFLAEETLFEVKRAKDSFNELDVGYFVTECELDNYTEDERVRYEKGDKKGQLRKYEKGTFIYRLAGREREKSASYYTPEVLTKCLVKYALKELLEGKSADEIIHLTICEPAMGSAAFLNEAINQLAEAYISEKQEELNDTIPFDKRFEELQKVKMYIADNNVFGVDLNPIAVELAEVSLWLNTIYKGAYVPWFGTQLVCGNSLIGARRQVYYTSKLVKGKWYDEAPDRIIGKDTRKRKGISTRVYHFLLGDPGMSNYSDKVIKGLEPENIKVINNWRKKFTEKWEEDDIQTLLRLSDIIDDLLDKTVELRKQVKKATSDHMKVYGYEESDESMHMTIREKDDTYRRMYKSEHMNNAGPYARLKAAMDYWCALWFWPIDKADLLPSRQQYLADMSLILEGTMKASRSTGQFSFLNKYGEMEKDEKGHIQYFSSGSNLEIEYAKIIDGIGNVDLEFLRQHWEHINIANEIAEKQRFLHWELEFADLFTNNSGFDLVLGNPPWVKMNWNESNILSDHYPEIYVKEMSSSEVAQNREKYICEDKIIKNYKNECTSTLGMLSFYNAISNYKILSGGQTDLFKCFLPLSWMLSNSNGVVGFVHPEGVYDDQNGGMLREQIFKRLIYHFQFQNEKYIFPIAHSKTFSINVYANREKDISFYNINNLYDVSTIDKCFTCDENITYGKKDDNGNWNVLGNKKRLLKIGYNELLAFSKIYGAEKVVYSKLPVIHTITLLEVLKCFTKEFECVNEKDFFGSEMWHETYDVRDRIIVKNDGEIETPIECVLSGPNIGEANMFAKQPRLNCASKGDYENIDLANVVEKNIFLPRVKYTPNNIDEYIAHIPKIENGKFTDFYRLVFRKMLSKSSELNMKCTIIPPKIGFVHSIIGFSFQNNEILGYLSGLLSSIVYIYLINSTGKMNFTSNTICIVPIPNNKYKKSILLRGLRLNALNPLYGDLWTELYDDEFTKDYWSIKHNAIKDRYELSNEWSNKTPIYTDFERYVAFVELDVLVAMNIGMTLEQLIDLFVINFPNMASNDKGTWYDQNGRIVFTTNKSFVNFGVTRAEWETNMSRLQFNGEDQLGNTYCYKGPYFVVDRGDLYKEVWHNFEERFIDK